MSPVEQVSTNNIHDLIKTDMMFWLLAAVQARGPFQKVSLAKALGLPNSDNPVLLWPSQKFTCPFCFILFFFYVCCCNRRDLACPVSKTIPVSRLGGGFGSKTRRCFWIMVKWFEMRVSFHFEQLVEKWCDMRFSQPVMDCVHIIVSG